MTPWGWKPVRNEGIWHHGFRGLKPLCSAAPWLMVLLLVLLFHLIGNRFTLAQGVLFDLPESGAAEGAETSAVALALPISHETVIFFDDARYALSDETSMLALTEHFAERSRNPASRTLLVLADRRISGGDLARLGTVARKGGFERMLLGERRAEALP